MVVFFLAACLSLFLLPFTICQYGNFFVIYSYDRMLLM